MKKMLNYLIQLYILIYHTRNLKVTKFVDVWNNPLYNIFFGLREFFHLILPKEIMKVVFLIISI